MSLLTIIAIAVALAAVLGAVFGLPDSWFCGLLTLACMLGGTDAAYRERTIWAVAFLLSGALFAGVGLHAAVRGGGT
jgi:hypothetical protein